MWKTDSIMPGVREDQSFAVLVLLFVFELGSNCVCF